MIAPLYYINKPFPKMNEQSKIIDEVREVLGIQDNVSDVQLCKLLRQKMASLHPDSFCDENAKQEADRLFKQYNSLYQSLKKHISSQNSRSSSALIPISDEEVIQFSYIQELDSKDKEIDILRKENKALADKNNILSEENMRLNRELNQTHDVSIKLSEENLQEIYRPRPIFNVTGITALVAAFAMVIPQFKDVLFELGLPVTVIHVLLWIVSGVWLFAWARKFFMNKILNSVESKILCGKELDKKLQYVSKEYYSFTETDLTEIVRACLRKGIRKLIVLYDVDETTKQLSEQIILELSRKHIIQKTASKGLVKYFYVNNIYADIS